MKGLHYVGNRQVKIMEMEIPRPKPKEVLIEVTLSALCGSERNDYEQGCSFVSGHEFVGIVREAKNCRESKPGNRVTVNVIKGCGKCYYCRMGKSQFCDSMIICQGGHAEYVCVPEECCLEIPEDVEDRAAVLLGGDTLGVAYRAVQKLPAGMGRVALVIGAGPIGLGAVSLLKYYGYYVVVWEMNPVRRKYALLTGADEAMDSVDLNSEQRIKELTNRLGADVVLECSGNPVGQKNALHAVRPEGTVVFCGENYKGLTIVPSEDIIHKEITLTGAFYFTGEDFYSLCELYRRGFEPGKAVSHIWNLAEAPLACKMFFEGKTGKVLLERKV